jgi:hypothetical protein
MSTSRTLTSEAALKDEMQAVKSEQKTLDDRYERAKEGLTIAERVKRSTIENDETARRIIAYFKQATQDEDMALYFLYKVTDALQNKFGGETAAKRALSRPEEWNLIRKIANASYGDIRHAPNPGEKIKEWSKEEIDNCFSAAERLLTAYFATLFKP